MSTPVGLFEWVLGAAGFASLAPSLRRVHCGRAAVLRGEATVTRGRSPFARLMCWVVRLPQAQSGAPARVTVEVLGDRERWTREFGASPPMSSILARDGNCLVERLGPLALSFALSAVDGAVVWKPVRARVLGVPIPSRWLVRVTAGASERGGVYHFDVEIVLPIVGDVIGYHGKLFE